MPRAKSKGRANSKSNAKHSGNDRQKQFWSGTISFGLVSVPVEMLPAHRRGRPGLRELDRDGTPVRRRFFCSQEERLVSPDEIARGYEYAKDQYVEVTDRELEALEPRKSREIDLQQFVDRSEISPLFFEKAYYLAPGGDTTKAYRLLAEALEVSERVGIATFVMREREYLVAIFGEAGILRGLTLRFVDEIRQPDDVGLEAKPDVDRRLLTRYESAIKALGKDKLDSKELEDTYTDRLKALVERKRKRGEDVIEIDEVDERPEDEQGDDVEGEDLLETLRRSLGGGRKRASRKTAAPTKKHAVASSRRSASQNARSGTRAKPSPSKKRP